MILRSALRGFRRPPRRISTNVPLLNDLQCILPAISNHATSATYKSDHIQVPVRQSSSSTRWKNRQSGDSYSRDAKVKGLKSRAAFKLLEIDAKYKLFKKGQTVVDLGYAPGSWSQVAVERTKPNGRIIGIDIIPAQPPKGVSTIQGNFLSNEVREEVKRFLRDPDRGRPNTVLSDDTFAVDAPSYIDLERAVVDDTSMKEEGEEGNGNEMRFSLKRRTPHVGRVVDLVLSDMMMNTSGINFKDHAGSMDLCSAALFFAFDTLKTGGHFVCKFYQGAEDKTLEKRLRKLFASVHREKPESSRSESKEAFFVALRRKNDPSLEEIMSIQ